MDGSMNHGGDLGGTATRGGDSRPTAVDRSRAQAVAALLSGAVFAVGLSLSGMTMPQRVLGFLDVAGEWDPSLAFVMVGAVGTLALLYRPIMGRGQPLLEPVFHVPNRKSVDKPLLLGALLFGAGWGLVGFCPGPAITALATFEPPVLLFFAAMVAGSLLPPLIGRLRSARESGETTSDDA